MPESRDLVDRLKDWTGRTAVPDALLNEAATLIEDLEKRVEVAEEALKEAVEAGETLRPYTQGFSENRAVQEAKEQFERARHYLSPAKEETQ